MRDTIHEFNKRRMQTLMAGSSRPKQTRAAFDLDRSEALRQLFHRKPQQEVIDDELGGKLRDSEEEPVQFLVRVYTSII